MEEVLKWLVDFVESLGYFGLFVMTLIESTFVPIPSEITMIPAGYLVQQGKLSFWIVLPVSVLGTIVGSYINYWIAKHHGRKLFLKYGKYFFMTPEKLSKLEDFYARHGSLSTFIGRLLPGFRHYISFPAGLAKMNLGKFFLYTAFGATIWMSVQLFIGYEIGNNEGEVRNMLRFAQGSAAGFVLLLIVIYVVSKRRK
jgi:membrane protein DedA with SNARE-associated domain